MLLCGVLILVVIAHRHLPSHMPDDSLHILRTCTFAPRVRNIVRSVRFCLSISNTLAQLFSVLSFQPSSNNVGKNYVILFQPDFLMLCVCVPIFVVDSIMWLLLFLSRPSRASPTCHMCPYVCGVVPPGGCSRVVSFRRPANCCPFHFLHCSDGDGAGSRSSRVSCPVSSFSSTTPIANAAS